MSMKNNGVTRFGLLRVGGIHWIRKQIYFVKPSDSISIGIVLPCPTYEEHATNL